MHGPSPLPGLPALEAERRVDDQGGEHVEGERAQQQHGAGAGGERAAGPQHVVQGALGGQRARHLDHLAHGHGLHRGRRAVVDGHLLARRGGAASNVQILEIEGPEIFPEILEISPKYLGKIWKYFQNSWIIRPL